jgi:hypothetical protein
LVLNILWITGRWETMLWKWLPKNFLVVIFFGDPNTVLAMTPNLKHALNNLKICRGYRFDSGL